MVTDMRSNQMLWLVAVLGAACSSKGAQDSGTDSVPADVVWAGWNHTWTTLSHRVSFIRAILEPDEGMALGIRGGDWSTGESWSDEANYRMQLQRVRGGGLQFVHGETSLTVGPEGLASATAEAEISGAQVAVVLRGFEIETDVPQGADYPSDYDPALGYTSRGFGFSVGAPTVEGDLATFEVSAHVAWGPRDRADMNAAMLEAETGVRVAWTAISYSGTETRQTLSDGIDLTHTPPNSPQTGVALSTGLEGGPGIAGITRFVLGVRDQDGADGGDYLRSFGAEILLGEAGAAPALISTEVTTTSLIELGTMHFAPEIDLVWIAPDAEDLTVEAISREGTHPVGPVDIDPDA